MIQFYNYGPYWLKKFLWKFGILWFDKKVLMHDAEHDYALFALILKERDGQGQIIKTISFGGFTAGQVKWVLTEHLLPPEESQKTQPEDIPSVAL